MERLKLNKNWQFNKGKSGVLVTFLGGITSKKIIDLPHDAMIGEKRDAKNPAGVGGAFFPGGEYEYVKKIFIPKEDKGKIFYLECEGVFPQAVVEVNGSRAGECAYGYSKFRVKIHDFLNFGEENEVKIVVQNNNQPNSRWYSGAGIYRDVYLLKSEALHFQPDGIKVTNLDIDPTLAKLSIDLDIVNESLCFATGEVKTNIKNQNGEIVLTKATRFSIKSSEKITSKQILFMKNPSLWDVDSPNLYCAEVELLVNGELVDRIDTEFGIRKLQLDTLNGLRINGKSIKLKGGCIHHDNGLLGSATYYDAEERRIIKLKEAGYNAIRSAHNPASELLLKACDKHGMLVMEEFSDVWFKTKAKFDYANVISKWWETDIESMVNKAYNHPSVILYSIGNEIPEVGSKHDKEFGRKIIEKIRSIDSTRFITNGISVLVSTLDDMMEIAKEYNLNLCDENGQPKEINQMMNEITSFMEKILCHPIIDETLSESFEMLDVVGYKYATDRYVHDLEKNSDYIIVGTETHPKMLDENWALIEKYPSVLGDFCWTAWDYLGEVGVGGITYEENGKENTLTAKYPWITAYVGEFDITGYRRPISYWRERIWGEKTNVPYIAVQKPEHYFHTMNVGKWSWTDSLNSWTWPGFEGKPIVVEAYCDSEEVELFVNGESQGRKKNDGEWKRNYIKWDTVYNPGILEVISYNNNKEVGRILLETATDSILKVEKEREYIISDTEELCYVNISLCDEKGRLNPSKDCDVTVSVEGPIKLLGFGSGNPVTERSFNDLTQTTFEGRLLAIFKGGNEKGVGRVTFKTGEDEVTIEIPVI